WVHSQDREAATRKAADLVRMAAARAALLEPQTTFDVPVQHEALVVGGGVAGMAAAVSLAEQGFPVHLVEKEAALGGNLRSVFTEIKQSPQSPRQILERLVQDVQQQPGISLHLEAEVVETGGFMGNFTSQIRERDGRTQTIQHGATILATGAVEYRGDEYGYGTDSRIVTQQEFEAVLSGGEPISEVAMIQCIGPAEKFCGRICCAVALKNALAVKERNPETAVTIFYRDIRTYGFSERLYTRARAQGVLFVRYDDETRPEVSVVDGKLQVKGWEPVLKRPLLLQPDCLVLSVPAVPRADSKQVASLFKAPLDADGFFQEAHIKLRPVDFNTDGIFMAGMAHYPKLTGETMIQAQAAAARAARVLSRDSLTAGGQVAVVDAGMCTGCLTCVRICPFGVPEIRSDLMGVGGIAGAAYIETAVCRGCGTCVSECPARAIQLMHYTDAQLQAKVEALVDTAVPFIPIREIEENVTL
ncbi:MAG: CoB--CoM heterodisulfide reductase iron-sulfur subunit A family protein, partial [Anaerolineae bacterium]